MSNSYLSNYQMKYKKKQLGWNDYFKNKNQDKENDIQKNQQSSTRNELTANQNAIHDQNTFGSFNHQKQLERGETRNDF